MRHERISQAAIAAAAWPNTLESLVIAEPLAPEADVAASPSAPVLPVPAAQDVAPGVGVLIAASYAGLTSAIMDARTAQTVDACRAADLLLGRDEWGMSWIAAHRRAEAQVA